MLILQLHKCGIEKDIHNKKHWLGLLVQCYSPCQASMEISHTHKVKL